MAGNLTLAQLQVQTPLLQGRLNLALQSEDNFRALGIFGASGARVNINGLGTSVLLQVESPDNFLGDPEMDAERAPGAPRREMAKDFPATTVTLRAADKRLQKTIDVLEVANANLDLLAMRQHQIMMARLIELEVEAANIFLRTGTSATWSTAALAALSGGTGLQFNAAGSRPLDDIIAAAELARIAAYGMEPTDLIIGWDAARTLMTHPQVLGAAVRDGAGAGANTYAAGGTRAPIMGARVLEQHLAALTGLRVNIIRARRRTNNLGQAVGVYAGIDATSGAGDVFWIGRLGSTVARTNVGAVAWGTAAIDVVHDDMQAGIWQTPDGLGVAPYIDDVRSFRSTYAVGTTNPFGYLVTDCIA